MYNVAWYALFTSILIYMLSYIKYIYEGGRTISFINKIVCYPRGDPGFGGPHKFGDMKYMKLQVQSC